MISPRLILLQGWRSYSGVEMGKWVQIGAPEAGEWSGEHLVYKGTVLREGRRPERLDCWLERWWRELEGKGYIPEIHLSNCWVLGGAPTSFDIVVDLEPAPFSEQLPKVLNVLGFLERYGIKAAAKVSSLREQAVGFHVYANLSLLWRAGLEKNWETFYSSLAKYLKRVYEVDIDLAFAHKHQYRAFSSPREEKGDPARLNCYNNWVSRQALAELWELGEGLGWDLARDALASLVSQPSEKVPRTGVFNIDAFLSMYEALANVELGREKRREMVAYTLPFIEKLHRRRWRHAWIERVLSQGLPDGRKRFAMLVAAPYLGGLVRNGFLTEQEAERKLLDFLKRSAAQRPLDFKEATAIKRLKHCIRNPVPPMSLTRFQEKYPDLTVVLNPLSSRRLDTTVNA